MAIQAKARLTFHQLVDGTTVSFTIGTSKGLTQVKSDNPVSFTPNYHAGDPQVFTPYLSIPGEDKNQIKGTCDWYANDVKIVSGVGRFTVDDAAPFALRMRDNLNMPVTRIRCEYQYTDPGSGLSTKLKTEISLTMVENRGASMVAIIRPDDALMFSTFGGHAKNLRFTGLLMRGGSVDNVGVAYEWFIQGTDGQFKKITGPTAPAGSGLPGGNLFQGWDKQQITVSSNAILNIGTLKLVCRDTEASSSTIGQTVEAVVSILDTTDPYDILADAKQGTNLSRGNHSGLPVEIIVRQGAKPLDNNFYIGKTLGFYRLTASDAKDATFAPSQENFAGWSIGGGEVKRKYFNENGKNGAPENRTIYIKNSHLLSTGGTTFEFFLDF